MATTGVSADDGTVAEIASPAGTRAAQALRVWWWAAVGVFALAMAVLALPGLWSPGSQGDSVSTATTVESLDVATTAETVVAPTTSVPAAPEPEPEPDAQPMPTPPKARTNPPTTAPKGSPPPPTLSFAAPAPDEAPGPAPSPEPAAPAETVTVGTVPPNPPPGSNLDDLAPDYIAWIGRDASTIGGYAKKTDLYGPNAVSMTVRPGVPAYAADHTTLVGHILADKGFIPIGHDPDEYPSATSGVSTPGG